MAGIQHRFSCSFSTPWLPTTKLTYPYWHIIKGPFKMPFDATKQPRLGSSLARKFASDPIAQINLFKFSPWKQIRVVLLKADEDEDILFAVSGAGLPQPNGANLHQHCSHCDRWNCEQSHLVLLFIKSPSHPLKPLPSKFIFTRNFFEAMKNWAKLQLIEW